jgi:hypothetical protein
MSTLHARFPKESARSATLLECALMETPLRYRLVQSGVVRCTVQAVACEPQAGHAHGIEVCRNQDFPDTLVVTVQVYSSQSNDSRMCA